MRECVPFRCLVCVRALVMRPFCTKAIIKLLLEYGADFKIDELVNQFGTKYPNKEPLRPCDVGTFT